MPTLPAAWEASGSLNVPPNTAPSWTIATRPVVNERVTSSTLQLVAPDGA